MTLFGQLHHRFLKGSYKEKTDEIIVGKKILDICESKLEKFTFMDNMDNKELRKFLLISRTMYLTNWKIDVLNSERAFLKECDAEDELSEDELEENDEVTLMPSIFDDVNTLERISGDIDFESYDDLSNIMSDEEFLDDEFIDDSDDEVNLNITDSYRALNIVSQEDRIVTNSDNNNNDDAHHEPLECYEYDDKENTREEEVDSLKEEDHRYIDHSDGGVSSVVFSIASIPSQSSKHGLNFDEEMVSDYRVTYKKVKYI